MDYKKMASQLLPLIGGKEDVSRTTRYVTHLRLTLAGSTKYDEEALGKLDRVEGVLFNSGQLQIIYGTKTVDAVYEEFLIMIGLSESTVAEVEEESTEDLKPLQKALKIFSDIFVLTIPAFMGAAMIVGVKSLLTTVGLFGLEGSLTDQSRLVADFAVYLNIIAATFTFLPVLVTYSAVKRSGGNPILRIVLGCIMIHSGLMDVNTVAADTVPQYWSLPGTQTPIVGLQGDIFFATFVSRFLVRTERVSQKHVPQVVSFIMMPSVTLLILGLASFLIFGPLGNLVGYRPGIVTDLPYNRCSIVGTFVFAALPQSLAVTGTHHATQSIEVSLVVNTGLSYIQPLWSVSTIAQGGACIGTYLLVKKCFKDREIAMSPFSPVLFGVLELAIFAVNVKDSVIPLIRAIAGAGIGGTVMKLLDVKTIGFALTGLPGLTIVYSPVLTGYIIGNLAALTLPIVFILVCARAEKLGGKQPQSADQTERWNNHGTEGL